MRGMAAFRVLKARQSGKLPVYLAAIGVRTPVLKQSATQLLRESFHTRLISLSQQEEIAMGQKWTTAHMLACQDSDGQPARVFHQIKTDNHETPVKERFVLGNGEPVKKLDHPSGAYLRQNGETLDGPRISLA